MIEIRFVFTSASAGQAELLRCVLLKRGLDASDIVETLQKGRLFLSIFSRSPAQAQRLIRHIRSLRLKGIAVSSLRLRDCDWKTQWKKYLKPFNITRDIRIIPSWMKNARIPRGSRPVYIDTTFGFGTGLHATTRMVARFIAAHPAQLERFLDIGTGSGILSIIARQYGAADIRAIDIDRQSIKTARENFRLNRCRPTALTAVDFKDFRTRQRFDFVAANLLTEDLIRLQTRLNACLRPGGLLAVSGIFADNYPVFRRKFKPASLRCLRVTREKQWYALLFKKS